MLRVVLRRAQPLRVRARQMSSLSDPEVKKLIEIFRQGHDPSSQGRQHGAFERERLEIPVEDSDLEDLSRRFSFYEGKEEEDYSPLEDPLLERLAFDPRRVSYETQRTITMLPGQRPNDCKVVLQAYLRDLELEPVVEKYVREICGPRYDWCAQRLRIVSRRYPTTAQNRRYVTEQLQLVIEEAQEMARKHGDFLQRGPILRNSGHKRRRAQKKRKAKKELFY